MKLTVQLLPFILLFLVISCEQANFIGIERYESISIKNLQKLNRAVEIIQANSKLDSTYFFTCSDIKNSIEKRVSMNNDEICAIFKQCEIKEAIRYKSGNINIVFNRLIADQDYGAFLIVEKNNLKDTITNKYLIRRVSNSDLYIKAETDW